MLGVLIRIALSWLLIAGGGLLLIGLVKEPGLGGYVYLVWGIAVALSGAAAHLILVFVPTFCRSIAPLQVVAISALALLFLALFALIEIGTTSRNIRFYEQALPDVVTSLLVVAAVVNTLFTPARDA